VLQPIGEIGKICRALGVTFHTDAAQAAGKIPLDVKCLGVDLMSLSGHKLYAPIGIGALYVSEESSVVPEPLFLGGGQERGIRSGTLAPHLCVAFGTASAIADSELTADADAAARLRDVFLRIVRARFPDIRVNCEHSPRLAGSLSLTFLGVDADRLVGAVQPLIAVSTNAACSAGALEPSHVLQAIGLSRPDAMSTLRISFGRFNTASEVERAAQCLGSTAARIRQNEPLDIAAA
jgi:cysteine desulfurase